MPSVEKQYFLGADVKMELLAFRWYAWTHLVAPLQHAMNMAYRQIPLLQSFIANPGVHAAAVKDPRMLGAPFADIPVERVAEANDMLVSLQSASKLLEFAQQLRELNRSIQQTASGFSLDAEYSRMPAILRGWVELVYDTNCHPKLRLREEILRISDVLNDLEGQEIHLTRIRDADRKFFLTTPRLRDEQALDLAMGFADARIDILSSLRIKSLGKAEILEKLRLPPWQASRLEELLTEHSPERREPEFTRDGVRLRYFGHACVLLQSRDSTVLIDPLFAWDRHPSEWCLTFDDLPDEIDYVILSHCHMDHCCPEMIVQLRQRVRNWIVPRNVSGEIADPSMKLILERLGCKGIIVADPFDTISLPDGSIVTLPFPGEHCGLDIASKQSASVTIRGRTFLFLVDSDAADPSLYRLMDGLFKAVDVIFIGMECSGSPLSWFYGPLLGKPMSRKDDESRRGNASNCARAWEAIRRIECGTVFVYAMGNEIWNRYLLGLEYSPQSPQIVESNEFVDRCRQAGKRAERLSGSRELYF